MKYLTVFTILAVAVCANGTYLQETMSNKDMFLRIIECAQKALMDGIPEIDLPSHNPFVFSENFNFSIPIFEYNLNVTMLKMTMWGIPYWNVTQMDDVTDDEENPVFDYTIYWKIMTFQGEWRASLLVAESDTLIIEDTDVFIYELDHLTFSGRFNFSKPQDDKEGGFNDLTLHFHTEESEVLIEGLGAISDFITFVGGKLLKYVVNIDGLAPVSGPAIRDKLNKDWIGKPERIEALISHCADTSIY